MDFKAVFYPILFLSVLASTLEAKWERPFFFVIMADPQVGWNRDGYNSEALFRKAVEEVNKLRPDFVLIAGDLVQDPGSEAQFQTTKSIADRMEMPYYVVAGNHDVGNPPTKKLLDWYSGKWKVPLWYTFTYYNVAFPMLETNVLRVRDLPGAEQEVRNLAKEHMTWLNVTLDTLTKAGYKHIYPLTHYPLAKDKIDEAGGNTNVLQGVREDMLGLFHKYNIKTVFAGHAHHNVTLIDKGLDLVTYAATGVILGGRDKSGFAVVKIDGDNMEQRYYGYADLPKSVESANPGFNITYPNTGEALQIGTIVPITWDSKSMSRDVKLEFTVNGSTWSTISDSTLNTGSYNWTIPNATSNNVKVRISSLLNPGIFDVSDGHNNIVTVSSVTPSESRSLITFSTPGESLLFQGAYKDYQRASIFGFSGKRLRTLALKPGANFWDGRDAAGNPLTSGIYFVRFESTLDRKNLRSPLKRFLVR